MNRIDGMGLMLLLGVLSVFWLTVGLVVGFFFGH
jgi:hypothetical protein